MMYTKLLETNAAVAVELRNFRAVAHAASRVVEQSKEARRRRNNFALPRQDHDIGRRRGHEADQENRRPYTATAKLGAKAVGVVALTLGNLPTTSARAFMTPAGEEHSGCAFVMMMIAIMCTVVIMQSASCAANSMCARPATRRLCKDFGTQTDTKGTLHADAQLGVVLGPPPTVTRWVAPTSGERYHRDTDCRRLVCAKGTRCCTPCQQCG